jgi:hypothetical protein
MLLSGIGKIWNCNKYHFPLDLSIESVLDGADEFVLTVCLDSEDDTVEYCKKLEEKYKGRLRLVFSNWRENPEEGKYTMRRLADLAIEESKGKWFVSVDMDEVYSIGEAAGLRKYLEQLPQDIGAVAINFFHHYIDIDTIIMGKLYDSSVRVAKKDFGWRSYDDGFGITGGMGKTITSPCLVNHYGFVRDLKIAIDKELRFQTDLYKPLHSQFPDPRLEKFKQAKVSKQEFYKGMMGPDDLLIPYERLHWNGVREWFETIQENN